MNDREKWRERESGISVLPARHDDDDDDDDIGMAKKGKKPVKLYKNPPARTEGLG